MADLQKWMKGMNEKRQFSLGDRLCLGIDQALRTLTNHPQTSGKPFPAKDIEEIELTPSQRKHSAGLMRVNHAGEVCAQALYHGQGLVSRNPQVQAKMHQASIEEGDHLVWCQQRIQELGSHASYLNPFWYAGSFCIGMVAGMVGDKWSLGFLAETEQQVIKHLEKHLVLLPPEDQRSHSILRQMELDESEHRDDAIALGAKHLPAPIKLMMSLTSKIMVKLTYWI